MVLLVSVLQPAISEHPRRREQFTVMIMLDFFLLAHIRLLIGLPIPSIDATIDVQHLSEALAEIVHIVPFVDVSIGPGEDSIALLFVIEPLALILVASSRTLLPHALPASQPVLEISFEKTAGRPVIFPITRWLSGLVHTFVRISVCESLNALSVLQAISELALVAVAIGPSVHSVTFRFSLLPLSDIRISLRPSPDSRTVLHSVFPLSFVHFSVLPLIAAASFRLAVDVGALVGRAVAESLKSLAVSAVLLPAAFEGPSVRIEHDSLAVPFSLARLAPVR